MFLGVVGKVEISFDIGKLSFTFAETQRKNARMDLLDSDDDTSSISSSSTMQSERPGMDEVQVHKDVMLDQSLDALYEQRYASPLPSLFNCIQSWFLMCFCLILDAKLIFDFFLDVVKEFNERASFGLHFERIQQRLAA